MLTAITLIVSLGALAAAVGAAMAALRSNWAVARLLAKSATLVGTVVLVPVVALVVAYCAAPHALVLLLASESAEERTAMVANTISATINSGSPSLLAVLVAGPLWFASARKLVR